MNLLIIKEKLGISLLSFLTVLFLNGCTQINDFPMGESYYQIKQVQILDVEAPERNDGTVLSLDGSYGEKVMQAYRDSSVKPQSSKNMGSTKASSSGSSGSGSSSN
jgi:hypothetical protein